MAVKTKAKRTAPQKRANASQKNPYVRAAVGYAKEFGWECFPLRDKKPVTDHGFKDATSDPAELDLKSSTPTLIRRDNDLFPAPIADLVLTPRAKPHATLPSPSICSPNTSRLDP